MTRCAGCQQEIEGPPFDSPWGPLCLACRLQSQQTAAKKIKPKKSKKTLWLWILMGLLVILSFLFSALIIQAYQRLPVSAFWINRGYWHVLPGM